MYRLLKNLLRVFAVGAIGMNFTATAGETKTAVLNHYADIAQAGYEDSLSAARVMKGAVDQFLSNPNESNMEIARQAWRDARVPYMQTEVYRFGNTIVDEWEGKVNAWPLDEGLIDYVELSLYGEESDNNVYYSANVIANPTLVFSGQTINASNITKSLLQESLHEADGNEANVASGYHAIEFLLWGQDLNGTASGSGSRPATDFDSANCTNGNCDRRAAYLVTAIDLLLDDLAWMAEQWQTDGEARTALLSEPQNGVRAMLTGMGSLSYGELAGERMKLGLILHDPEEEHDCFSDNTHFSHFYNAKGIQNIFLGTYTRVDGSVVSGPGIAALLGAVSPDVEQELEMNLLATMQTMQAMVDTADAGEAYDQMIGEDNPQGNAIVQSAIDALVNQTRSIEKAVTKLGLNTIEFEGSDSLDAPENVGA